MNEKSVMERALEIATSPTAKAESVALYSVKTDNQSYASFLSIGWGLMADIDIDSEKWRKSLGHHRFTVMGFIRSCSKILKNLNYSKTSNFQISDLIKDALRIVHTNQKDSIHRPTFSVCMKKLHNKG